jgi:nucleoid-associated protein YgaU
MSLSKAYILNVDTGDRIECLFNPKEYTFSKSNDWGSSKGDEAGPQQNAPGLKFKGGQPTNLKMQLFFDTYHLAKGAQSAKDVRSHTEKIWELMYVRDDKRDAKTQFAEPPKVRFMWGQTWTFDAVIESISQQFTMFLADGTPVRATLDVSFKQIKDEHQLKAQNPTSGGVGGEQLWTVREGDTLARIAFQTLGSGTLWRGIAEANNLEDIRDLEAGRVLVIPV